MKVTGKIGIFIIKNENCVNGHPYLGVCTQPKWTNQVSRMDFWWSVYSSSTSFFLEQRHHCTALHCQKKDLSIIKVVALLELKVNICTSIFKIKSTHHHNLLLSTSTHKEIIFWKTNMKTKKWSTKMGWKIYKPQIIMAHVFYYIWSRWNSSPFQGLTSQS